MPPFPLLVATAIEQSAFALLYPNYIIMFRAEIYVLVQLLYFLQSMTFYYIQNVTKCCATLSYSIALLVAKQIQRSAKLRSKFRPLALSNYLKESR